MSRNEVNIAEVRERARRAVGVEVRAFAIEANPSVLADAASDVWEDELKRLYTRIAYLEAQLELENG